MMGQMQTTHASYPSFGMEDGMKTARFTQKMTFGVQPMSILSPEKWLMVSSVKISSYVEMFKVIEIFQSQVTGVTALIISLTKLRSVQKIMTEWKIFV